MNQPLKTTTAADENLSDGTRAVMFTAEEMFLKFLFMSGLISSTDSLS